MSKVIIIIVNLFGFSLCAYDKFAAKAKFPRVPEKLLLSIAACFGSMGIFCGMFLFRHKTRHKRFLILVPVFLVLQIVILSLSGIVGIVFPAIWLI
ncbi:MAG: DUF1294 domain-containing protein [Ruminococcaceae bacterium]|nr:DUF1294 domain-containing protein [Oscillospiraceae bacterium]